MVTYGLGRNKKSSKNKSAFRMLKMLGGVEAINSVKMETRKMEAAKLADVDRVREIVYSEMNAISALETLNKIRGHSLRFTETSKDIGVQVGESIRLEFLWILFGFLSFLWKRMASNHQNQLLICLLPFAGLFHNRMPVDVRSGSEDLRP